MGNIPGLPECSCDVDSEAEGTFDELYGTDGQVIGTGKFSEVQMCYLRSNPDKRYALKVINPMADETAPLKQVQDEINILQMLTGHPNIVELIDVDQQPHCIRLVLDLCEGGELYDKVQAKGYYQESEAKECIRGLLEAVAFFHGKGVMHRDLKPENILLVSTENDTDVKVSDFGLAKVSYDFPRKLPRANSTCGSDFYLAPEVIKQEEYGREVDVWACGVITYVVMSGTLPFYNQTLHKLYRQIVERDISFPSKPWATASKGAQDFVLRLLHVRAGERLTATQALSHPWLA
mmetsp:Transcript_11219/g.25584  ORF Transcript_11219/g.25584 Transcript_11219/m.25584 type:complete len:292 (+) Transcript_11219:54-929(+)